MDAPSLQALIDEPTIDSRAILFAHLANSKAAVRAKAAGGLLMLYAKQRFRSGLARDFGNEPEAILTRCLDELRELIDEPRTDAWTRFIKSLEMDQDSWRDGTGYDIEALHAMSEIERGAIRELIVTRLGRANRSADWRDLQAAAALNESAAIAARTEDPDPNTRLRAKVLVASDEDIAAELCRTISSSSDQDAVSKALDHVANYATVDVKEALIARVRKVDSQFIVAAMVLLEVFGNVEDTWNERSFLFNVQADGPNGSLLTELLARVGAQARASDSATENTERGTN